MAKKLMIISIDAMGALDIKDFPDKTPTLQQLIQSGTLIEKVTPIYPSLTYPSHVTLMTGCFPNKHGIVNNTKIQAHRLSPDWYWYDKDIKVPTLYDMAQKHGLTTASFLWPATANSSIRYNIAEIFPNRPWMNQFFISLKTSSPLFLFQLNQKYKQLRHGIEQPFLDDFITACATDTIHSKKSDLTLIHLVDMDNMRHRYGVTSDEAINALSRQDNRVKKIIEATIEADVFNETNFVILGDHYQIDVEKMIRLNTLFVKNGWASPTKEGGVQNNWDVYAKSCDGSTYIYCKENRAIKSEAIIHLIEKVEGIETIYSSKQIHEFGADTLSTWMVEAKRGYYFDDTSVGPLIETVPTDDIGTHHHYRAVHGFSPEKEQYATTAIFFGPDIKKNYVISQMDMVDGAPTFARLLEINDFPTDIDGHVIEAIFI